MADVEQLHHQLYLDDEMLEDTCQSTANPPPIPARSPLRLLSAQSKSLSHDQDIRTSTRLSIDTTLSSPNTAYQQVTGTHSFLSDDESVPELDSPKSSLESSRTSKNSSPGPSTPDMEYPLDVQLFSQVTAKNEPCYCTQCEESLPGIHSPHTAVAPLVSTKRKVRTRSQKPPSFLMLLDDHASIRTLPSRSSFSSLVPQHSIPEQYGQYRTHSRQRQSLPTTLPSHPAVRPISRDGTNRLVARQEIFAVSRSRNISITEIDCTSKPPTPSIRNSSLRGSYHHRLRDSLDLGYTEY
jgi:hypothetical protein